MKKEIISSDLNDEQLKDKSKTNCDWSLVMSDMMIFYYPSTWFLAKISYKMDQTLYQYSKVCLCRRLRTSEFESFHGLLAHRFIQNTLLAKKDFMRQSAFIFQCLTKHFKCKTCLEGAAERTALFAVLCKMNYPNY